MGPANYPSDHVFTVTYRLSTGGLTATHAAEYGADARGLPIATVSCPVPVGDGLKKALGPLLSDAVGTNAKSLGDQAAALASAKAAVALAQSQVPRPQTVGLQ